MVPCGNMATTMANPSRKATLKVHVLATCGTTSCFGINETILTVHKFLLIWPPCLDLARLPLSCSPQNGVSVDGRGSKAGPFGLAEHLKVLKCHSLLMGCSDDSEG